MDYAKAKKLERLGRRLDKQSKNCLAGQCKDKVQHENFLSAMTHCIQLGKISGILYSVYHCETCGFAHVGHTDQPSITWMMDGYSETINTKLR